MNKHTPGPWKIGKFLRVYGGEKDHFGGQMLIANVNGGRVGGGDGDANARLIAAAPDLLEALKGWTAWAGDGSDNEELTYITRARAAIAKAEGE